MYTPSYLAKKKLFSLAKNKNEKKENFSLENEKTKQWMSNRSNAFEDLQEKKKKKKKKTKVRQLENMTSAQ